MGAGAVTVAVVGGGVWRAYDQGVFSIGEGPAYEPWKDWRDTNDGPLTLVRAAILAASPHNTQPWLFKVANSSIELHIDTQRNVGALDPYLREEHIGIGCALENLMLTAPANGYAATVRLEPGQLEPISRRSQPKAGRARSRSRRADFLAWLAIKSTTRGCCPRHPPIARAADVVTSKPNRVASGPCSLGSWSLIARSRCVRPSAMSPEATKVMPMTVCPVVSASVARRFSASASNCSARSRQTSPLNAA